VIVGGAPLTQDFADMIGADGYASDAASAVEAAKRVLEA
jgi:methanogenic corrinoid protein MtbC1